MISFMQISKYRKNKIFRMHCSTYVNFSNRDALSEGKVMIKLQI